MRFIKNIMSRKPAPEEMNGAIEFEMDVEPLRRDRPRAEADDSGQPNASAVSAQEDKLAEAKRLFGLEEDTDMTDDLPDPSPEEAADPAFADDNWDDESWDDDEDWGDEWDAPDAEDDDPAEVKALEEKAHLVEEIREAMGAVSHIAPEEKKREAAPEHRVSGEKNWSMDEEFGRKAIARKELGLDADASEERLLEKANWELGDDEGSRRRSAMMHLKAAAKATKADRVLSNVVGRDPASDPDEQSPYRADLAKVVRPRPTSRPAMGSVRPSPIETPKMDDEGDDSAWMGGDSAPEFSAKPSQTAESIAAEAAERGWNVGDDTDASDEDMAIDTQPEPVAAAPKIWDMNDDDAAEVADVPAHEPVEAADVQPDVDAAPAPAAEAAPAEEAPLPGGDLSGFAVPAPASGRAGRSRGRVKTRLLGFQGGEQARDVFADANPAEAETPVAGQPAMFPVGWIVVVDGPGRGASFTLFSGVSQMGRGEDQAIKLDFGDTAISRQNHAAVAFDDEQKKFFLGHGGKSNLVRLNDRPVLSTEELTDGDLVRIGETTLRFVALCNEEFGWDANEGDGGDHAILA